jgi:hypothetical protein
VRRPTDRTGRGGRSVAALFPALAMAACVPAGHLAQDQTASPPFDPIRFFAGRTQGTGSLKIVLHSRQATLVTGMGIADGDRSIVLEQEVRRGDDPPTPRTWRLRALGAGHYGGSLSDATGPVTGKVVGNRLHLRFAMKGGLQAQQWLYLQPGGQIARNRMVITKFGLPIASLDETITRVAP